MVRPSVFNLLAGVNESHLGEDELILLSKLFWVIKSFFAFVFLGFEKEKARGKEAVQ